jgi:Lon protease-like protein
MGETRDLPLFPLNVVLFPTVLLPLRIFEERYKLMLQQCLQGDQTFGVVLIKSGREVGGPAAPHPIGTQARIVDVVPRPDGRFNLAMVGVRPFRILELLRQEPYLVGRVEFLQYEMGQPDAVASLAEPVRQAFRKHIHLLAALTQQQPPDSPLDMDPEDLSYAVAGGLQVGVLQKQDLLETPTVEERMRKELKMLEEENKALQIFVALQGRRGSEEGPPQPGPRFSKN